LEKIWLGAKIERQISNRTKERCGKKGMLVWKESPCKGQLNAEQQAKSKSGVRIC